MARALYEDWEQLDVTARHAELRALARRVQIDTSYTTLVLTISTGWGTDERFYGTPKPLSPVAKTAATGRDDVPKDLSGPDPLITAAEAAKLVGVSRNTIHQWRRAGLLPRTMQSAHGPYLFDLLDLRRAIAAPKCSSGRSHEALRLQINARGSQFVDGANY